MGPDFVSKRTRRCDNIQIARKSHAKSNIRGRKRSRY